MCFFAGCHREEAENPAFISFVIGRGLIRISHRLSTAASDTGMFTALRSVGLLDILSSMPAVPKEPVRGLKGIAFRAPRGRMQGTAPQVMFSCIIEARQRSRWPCAAGTLRAHGDCGQSLRCSSSTMRPGIDFLLAP